MKNVKKCNFCNKEHSIRNICTVLNEKGIDLKQYFKEYEDGESSNIISQKLGISVGCFINLLRLYGIKTRSVQESTKLPLKKEKCINTNLERYGSSHNMNRDHPSRKKMKENLLEKYGVENVFQLEEVKEKIKHTLIEKYNVESPYKIKTSRGSKVYSSVHKKVVSYLLDQKIDILIEKKLGKKNSSIYYSYDIIVNNTNKLIEVNGDYWHGNPEIYKPYDIILKGTSAETTVSEKWKKDEEKINYAKQNGYDVYVIWEKDLNNSYEQTLSKLTEWINADKPKSENQKDHQAK